jgi:hypothetical protein
MISLRSGLLAAAATGALVLSGVAPATAQTNYANCTALHRDFKHGVAKSYKAAKKQVRQGYGMPAHGKHARKVYWANYKSLDRDRDGTACEA